MNLWSRISEAGRVLFGAASSMYKAGRSRAVSIVGINGAWTFKKSSSGVMVGPDDALYSSAYYACIRNISEDIARLPVSVLRKTETGNERVEDSGISALFSEAPNDEMTWLDFCQTITAYAQGWGNGFAEIQRNIAGTAVAMWPIHPATVQVQRDQNGVLQYLVMPSDGFQFLGISNGQAVVIPAENMLHLKGLGGDGLVGYSVARYGSESIGTSLAAQQQAGQFFGNGMTPSGVLTHPATLSEAAQANLVRSFEDRHKGSENAHRMMVLEEGMEYKQMTINPKDAMMLETRRFQVEEIARWFRMPLSKLQDRSQSTYNNVEQESLDYTVSCLGPWVSRWEQELRRKLIARGSSEFIRFDMSALLRGDQAARAQYYREMFGIGVFSINEIRTHEGLNPIPDGDGHYYPLNMAEVGDDMEDEMEDDMEEPMPTTMPMTDEIADAIRPAVERVMRQERSRREKAMCAAKKAGNDSAAWRAEFYSGHAQFLMAGLEPILHMAANLTRAKDGVRFSSFKALDAAVAEYCEKECTSEPKFQETIARLINE